MAAADPRAKQRWDGDTRLVCGCVLFRERASAPGTVELLLVCANKRKDYIFPKVRDIVFAIITTSIDI